MRSEPVRATTRRNASDIAGVLLSVGHGTADQEELRSLLVAAGVETVVDVRRFPGSRRHPHVARDAMARWLHEAGIASPPYSTLGWCSDPRVPCWPSTRTP